MNPTNSAHLSSKGEGLKKDLNLNIVELFKKKNFFAKKKNKERWVKEGLLCTLAVPKCILPYLGQLRIKSSGM